MLICERVRLRRVERDELPRCVAWLNNTEACEDLATWRPMGLRRDERRR